MKTLHYKSTLLLALASLLISLVGGAVIATPAHAVPADIIVDSLLDTVAIDGNCTLREAVQNANNNAATNADCEAGIGVDTIKFSVSGTIPLGSTLVIEDAVGLTLDGTGQTVTISGENNVRVLGVWFALTLNNLTIANGNASDYFGGGIWSTGTLIVSNSTFSNNKPAINSGGGGIFSQGGTLTITNSTFSGNSVPTDQPIGLGLGVGGGVYIYGGTATITNSTFSGNSVSAYGGGIYVYNATMTVTNSTFSGNIAAVNGSGGIFSDSTTLTLSNSILANNTGGNCGGTITNGGHNIDDGATCGWGSASGSISGTDPLLGSLADNGGPTQTFALTALSPAIDSGDDAICTAAPVNGLDQRGVARPFGAQCDIGSYEYDDLPATPTLLSPGGTISDTHPPYSWNAAPSASSYRLAVWSMSTSSYPVLTEVSSSSCTGGVCTTHPATVLPAGAYRFKVLARNAAGSSPYSAWMNFTVLTPPAAPVLLSPSGTITDTHPPYSWNASTGATSYTLAVYSNSSLSYVILKNVASSYCSGGICSYHPATVLPPGAYRFKVLARNAAGPSAYSAWMNFGIPPATPVLLSPGGTISDHHPPYRWNASTGATSYTIAVWSNASLSYVFVTNVSISKCTAGVCTYHPATILPAGGYRFKVLARNAAGASPYSAFKSFTVSP